MGIRWSGLTIDCADPALLAAFWAVLLGRTPGPSLPGWITLPPGAAGEPRINFQPVLEPKQGKVRIHLDLTVDDITGMVSRVVELGGQDTGERHEYDAGIVAVLADPEGNEFCLVQYYASASRT